MEVAHVLSAVEPFASLGPGDRTHVAGLAVLETHAAGIAVVTQGGAADDLYFIAHGEADVVQDGERVNVVRPGEFFGELATVAGQRYSATVRAATELVVLRIRSEDIPSLLERPGVAVRLMDRMVRWLLPAGSTGADAPEDAAWSEITSAEARVVDLVVDGRSNPDIASALQISRHTVESHLKSVFRKLGVSSRTELAVAAARRGG